MHHVRAILFVLPLVACGADDNASFSDVGNWQEVTADVYVPSEVGEPDASRPDTSPPPPPPEVEVDFDLRTPEAGDTFLYIPSAALDALVVVDARTLDVHLVEVGVTPTLVRALPGDAGAIVLNEGSSDLSIVRPRGPTFDVTTIEVIAGANRLVLSPDGSTAFAFFATTRSGVTYGSLQDVTAITLGAEPAAHNLAVGFRPELVLFADAGRLALVVCEDGLSGVALADITRDVFLPPVPTSPNRFEVPIDREILPTPDGRYTFVRTLNRPAVARVDLATGALADLPLPDFASDIDLAADGTLIAPLRTRQEVALIAPDAWTTTDVSDTNPHVRFATTGAAFGSTLITADQRHALLYTTTPGVSAIGMLDMASAAVVIAPLTKEIERLAAAPDGRMAALLHRRASGAGDLALRDAYSLLDLASGYIKLVVTPHAVTEVAFTRDAGELFVLLPDPLGATHEVQRIDAQAFAVTAYRVPDRPVFVGAMPAIDKVAIALDNPTGWITFIDLVTDRVLQLNSFELNDFIE